MKRPSIVKAYVCIWLIVNVIGLTFAWHTYVDYLDKEYVVDGRGSNAKIVTKQEDPEMYAQRMVWFPTVFLALPLGTAFVLYLRYRNIDRENEASD